MTQIDPLLAVASKHVQPRRCEAVESVRGRARDPATVVEYDRTIDLVPNDLGLVVVDLHTAVTVRDERRAVVGVGIRPSGDAQCVCVASDVRKFQVTHGAFPFSWFRYH